MRRCALIALDPHTGEVKALIGGRNYGMSQLNHMLAKRQPGSIFKPFVYAAAMNTGITPGAPLILTPASMVMDEPTTFWFDDKPYEPSNFDAEIPGTRSRCAKRWRTRSTWPPSRWPRWSATTRWSSWPTTRA